MRVFLRTSVVISICEGNIVYSLTRSSAAQNTHGNGVEKYFQWLYVSLKEIELTSELRVGYIKALKIYSVKKIKEFSLNL